ncbi:MAG: MFS transporter [Candidatus Electrothrix sp. YB6]
MTSGDRAVLTVTSYGHFLSHCNMLVFPALALPLSKHFGLGLAATVELGFLMYLLFGITALPWGMLADKYGSRPLLALFYCGAGCCAFAAALSTDSPAAFQLALAGIGLFSGIYHPAGLGWIARSISRTAAGMAINGIFGNLGLAAGPLLAGLLNWLFDIRAVYFCIGMLNFSGLVFLLRTGKKRAQGGSSEKTAEKKGRERFTDRKGFGILLVCMMLGGMVYRGATVTLPALFELNASAVASGVNSAVSSLSQNSAVSGNMVATMITACLYLIGMAGQYTGGLAGERYDLRYGYLLFHLLTVPAAFLIGRTADFPLVLAAAGHTFFLLGMQPLENTLVARLTPSWMRSSAYGMKFVLTFGVGAVSVKLIAALEQGRGLATVFSVLGAVSVLLVVAIGILIRYTPPIRS